MEEGLETRRTHSQKHQKPPTLAQHKTTKNDERALPSGHRKQRKTLLLSRLQRRQKLLRHMTIHQHLIHVQRRKLMTDMRQRILRKTQKPLTLRRQTINLPRPIIIQIPHTLNVTLLLQRIQQRINRTRPKINTKILPNTRNDLISVHRRHTQIIQNNQIQKPLHQPSLNITQTLTQT